MMMYFAGYSGQPTANRAGGVNTTFTDCAVYSEVSYSPGFTTSGSDATAASYKQYAAAYNNANGRFGMEWAVNTPTFTIGWNGSTNAGDVGGSGTDTVSINGTALPWSTSGGSGVWVVEQVVCWYTEMRTVDSDTVRYKTWSWLKGSNPTTNPQLDRTVNISVGTSLPKCDRVAWGENFNQRAGFRYIANGGYMDNHAHYVWDLGYDANPLNL